LAPSPAQPARRDLCHALHTKANTRSKTKTKTKTETETKTKTETETETKIKTKTIGRSSRPSGRET